MKLAKDIAGRIFALFLSSALAIVGGASVLAPELELWKSAALSGLAAAFQVIQKLATSYYDDGKLTREEINAAFNVQTRSKKDSTSGEF
jgi:predicted outer membrane lipoprotein